MFVELDIVPRVLFEAWTADDFTALFSSESEQDACSRTLIQFLQVIFSTCFVFLVFPFLCVVCQVAIVGRSSCVQTVSQ